MDNLNTIDPIHQAEAIPGQTWCRELRWLSESCADSQCHAEIGTFCGRSLYAVARGMTAGRIWCVDNCTMLLADGYSEPAEGWTAAILRATLVALETAAPNVAIKLLRSDSTDAARQLAAEGVRLDSLWIDGGHTREQVTADISAWLPLVRPGGLICGHDYWARDAGVMDAVNDLLPDFQVVSTTRIWYAQLD